MHMPSRAADRTRSRAWRAGTRRNKRHRSVFIIPCPSRKYCLIHATVAHPGRPACMAMRLTRCEQLWVDDVIARRPHTHIEVRRNKGSVHHSNQIALLALIRRISPPNTILMPNDDIVMVHGDSAVGHSYHVPPGGVVAGMDYGFPDRFNMVGLGRSWGKAAAMEAEVARHRAMGYDVVQYGPMQFGRSR